MADKAKYWVGVCYLENMKDNWQEDIGDLLQLPYAYCIHDMDSDSKSEHRKDHVHIMIVFSNTTTYNNALNVFMRLSKDGSRCINKCESCVSVRGSYDYLIHDTETCKKKGKYLYPVSCRITGNNFDIGSFEQVSAAEKKDKCKELCSLICDMMFTNFTDFYFYVISNYDDSVYFDCIQSYSGLFERLTKGNFQKYVLKHNNSDTKLNYITGEIIQ